MINNIDEVVLPNSTVRLLPILVNSQHEFVKTGYLDEFPSTKIQPKFLENIPCDLPTYSAIQGQIESTIESLSSVSGTALDGVRFRLDSSLFNDAYAGCKSLRNGLVSSTPLTTAQLSQDCFSDAGTNDFLADPCCNYVVAWQNVN